jgi:preprotein translocase subunit SecE
MKPSKNAMFDYFLAVLIVSIGIPLGSAWNNIGVIAMTIAVSDLLFIFGIQTDIYNKIQTDIYNKEEKPNV